MSEDITAEKRDRYLAEIEGLRATNRKLRRAIQQVEGPWQSRAIKAENQLKFARENGWQSFERMCNAHQEIKRIFMLFWPNKEQKFNSVMDLRWNEKPEKGAVYANMIGDEVRSIRVLDYLKDWLDKNGQSNT